MTHKESWHKKILKEKKREVALSAIFAILLALVVSLWHFFTGKSFEWRTIDPIEAPDLLPRLFYSALVYVTLGAFLYSLGFYKFLYSLYRGSRGGYRRYKKTKGMIWVILILGMYFIIIPVVVSILNSVLSFCYNIFNLILYLLPSTGVTLLVFVAGHLILKNMKARLPLA